MLRTSISAGVLSAGLLTFAGFAAAQVSGDYQLINTIPVASNLQSFDISWIDQGKQQYYLADRGNGVGQGRIDVIDTDKNVFLYSLPTSGQGFAGIVPAVTPGCNISGPNGVVSLPSKNQLYVGDGDSTLKVVDLASNTITAVISTGGSCRADELAYDPIDHIIMVTNPGDSPPFLTFVSADTQSVLGRFFYPTTQVGLEQPVWDTQTYRFLISVPAVSPSTQGSVDEFEPLSMTMTNSYPIGCSPAGLAIGPLQRAMTSCGDMLSARTGNVIGSVTLPAGVEIWFNPGDNRYYFGNTNVGIIDADSNQFIGLLTDAGGHSIAVDSNNNRIFVPVTGVGIKVFARMRH